MSDLFTVKFFTVNQQTPDVECDSIRIPVSDKTNGEFSGYYGIRKGHAKAIFSLKAGKLTASLNGKDVFSADIPDGFAIVENNVVSITVDSISIDQK